MPTFKKNLIVFLALAAVLLLPLAAGATMVSVPLVDGTATNTITNLSGVVATGGWDPATGTGFSITSTVTQFVDQTGSIVYEYDYSVTVPRKNISHIIIGVSQPPAGTYYQFWQGTVDNHTTALTPNLYTDTSNGQSNPNLPTPPGLYGIKFPENSTSASITFFSYNAPVWQDFYAKDGKDGGVKVTAWNTGFGATNASPYASNYIIGPDSTGGGFVPVPVPPGVWLLGSGLLGLGAWSRIRKS
jgi:hypothetical protein